MAGEEELVVKLFRFVLVITTLSVILYLAYIILKLLMAIVNNFIFVIQSIWYHRYKLCGIFATVIAILIGRSIPDLEFDAYSLGAEMPLEGALAYHDTYNLNRPELLYKGEVHGPESLTVRDNIIYAGLATGEIVALKNDTLSVVADLLQPCRGFWDFENCGRPLGLAFDKKGSLFVADAYYGIYKINVTTGNYSLIVPSSEPIATNSTLEEIPMLPNAVTLAADGTIYWSDSSTKLPLHNLVIGLFGDKSGRLIKTNPETGKSEVLMSGLRFANGIFLADDESYIAVAECFQQRVLRYWLKGPKKGQSEIFMDNLPGTPDNMTPWIEGGFIVNLLLRSNPIINFLAPYPAVRKGIAGSICLVEKAFEWFDQYFPSDFNKEAIAFVGHFNSVAFFTQSYSIALFCDKDGNILKSLHADDGYFSVSEVVPLGNYYYFGSPSNDFIGKTDRLTESVGGGGKKGNKGKKGKKGKGV